MGEIQPLLIVGQGQLVIDHNGGWHAEGVNVEGVDASCGQRVRRVDEEFQSTILLSGERACSRHEPAVADSNPLYNVQIVRSGCVFTKETSIRFEAESSAPGSSTGTYLVRFTLSFPIEGVISRRELSIRPLLLGVEN